MSILISFLSLFKKLTGLTYDALVLVRFESMGAFHSTKNSGLKFLVFHVTNGTVFSVWLGQVDPGQHVPSFPRKYEINQGKTNMADSLPLLLALELLDDSEVELNDVLGEDDDVTLFSVASCYMRRNLNRVCDYFEGTIIA